MKGYSVRSLRRVNSEQAHLVASAYAAAPSVASDPNVGAAYAELSDQARGWFARLTTDQARRPVRVVFTRCRELYSDARVCRSQSGSTRSSRSSPPPTSETVSTLSWRHRSAVPTIASEPSTTSSAMAGCAVRSIVRASSPPGTSNIACIRAWPGGHWRRSCTRSTACSGRQVNSPNSRRRFSPLISSSPPCGEEP